MWPFRRRQPFQPFVSMKKRPALEKFVDEALPLVAVNLEQFA
jgi:hypothetical protein